MSRSCEVLLNDSPISRLLGGVKMSPVSLEPSRWNYRPCRGRPTCELDLKQSGAAGRQEQKETGENY